MGIYSDRLYCNSVDWLWNEPFSRHFVDSPEKISNQDIFGLWEIVTDHHGELIEANWLEIGTYYQRLLNNVPGGF